MILYKSHNWLSGIFFDFDWISCKNILIGGVKGPYNYIVYGERKDIDKLEIEPLKV